MQPPLQDPFAIPRRALDMEDYIDILRRHKGWVLGPFFASIVITTVVAFLWPDTYVSKAVIRVTPPQIPDRLVQSTVTSEMSQRINTMAQAIMSRTQLTNMINSFNLYPKDRRRLPMEDVIENMKKDVKISMMGMVAGQAGPEQKVPAFQLSFSYDNRIVAQKVCQELVSRFIDENIRTRSSQTVMTVEFMKDQLEERKRKLEDIDKRLTDFRVANAGRLPEQVQQNVQALNVLESRLGNLNIQVARSKQDQMILEAQLNSLRDNLRFVGRPIQQQMEQQVGTMPKSERLLSLERDVQTLETKLQAAMEVYVESHPDVVNLKSALGVAKRQRDQAAKEEEGRKAPADSSAGRMMAAMQNAQAKDMQEIQTRIAQTQSLIEAKKLEAETLQRDYNSTQMQAKGIEARVTATPLGEAKYDELMRDRMSAKQAYEEILTKQLSSEMGKKLEERKQGELLDIVDPASLPQSPTQPIRSLIIGAGAGVGLILGLLVAAAREMKDSTLKNLKDVRAYTQLTVLGSVPLLENDLVVRRRRRLAWLAWSTACLAGCMVMAGSVIFYLTTRG